MTMKSKLASVIFCIHCYLLFLEVISAEAGTFMIEYGGADFFQPIAYSVQQAGGGYISAGLAYTSTSDYFGWVLSIDSSGNIQWQKAYNSPNYEGIHSIQQTSDGGYVFAGRTDSLGGGSANLWVVKVDSSGNIQWQKAYGGSEIHLSKINYYTFKYPVQIKQTVDNGYIVASSGSFSETENYFAWILKIDSLGNVLWQKTYDGSGYDSAHSVQQTSDGGYVFAGITSSFGVNSADLWVVKLDPWGNVQWEKTYDGGSIFEADLAHSIQQTSDGGYVVAGRTSIKGILLRLTSTGEVTWTRSYSSGGFYELTPYEAKQTSDGCYIIVGRDGGTYGRAVILKVDASGVPLWGRNFGSSGGSRPDTAYSIQETSDSGYIVSGRAGKAWIAKVDRDGWVECPAEEIIDYTPTWTDEILTTVNSTALVQTPSAPLISTDAIATDLHLSVEFFSVVPSAGDDAGGCFIATAAYGSPFERHVQILQEFRDRYLVTNLVGREFVSWYYEKCPAAATYISERPPLRFLTRVALYPVVVIAWLALHGIYLLLIVAAAGLYMATRHKRRTRFFAG